MKEHSESGFLYSCICSNNTNGEKKAYVLRSERVGGKERVCRRAAERAGGEEGEHKVVN